MGSTRSRMISNLAKCLTVLGCVLLGVPAYAQPKIDPKKPIVVGKGLLSEDDVVNYAKQQFGPGDPFADSKKRQIIIERIRDYIKERGVNFLWSLDFDNKRLIPIGANAVHVHEAIAANYGYPPKREAYYGTWHLRTTKAAKITADTIDGERGTLIINKDGTYIWKINRKDPPNQWVQGTWREAKPDEMNPTEGGSAIWITKAKEGQDYMVRFLREPDWGTWVVFGVGRGRTGHIFGRKL